MKRFKFIDPAMIMTIVITLMILAVGVYVFFTVITNAATSASDALGGTGSRLSAARLAINNTSAKGTSVFNIIGVVLIIGAIMTIVGLVMSYVKPGGY